MSLYHMLHNVNVYAGPCLAALGLKPDDVGRFRDVYLDRDDAGQPRIRIHTRNGGGNRPDFEDVLAKMKEHPNFLFDEDFDFDTTYCDYVFSVPEDLRQVISENMDKFDLRTARQKWDAAFLDLKNAPGGESSDEVREP